jgi:hypothetical protein
MSQQLQNFYSFGSKLLSKTFQTGSSSLDKIENGARVPYDMHLIALGKYENVKLPVTFKQEYGKELADVLDTGWIGFYLISNKFKKILEDNKISGWNTFPIILLDKLGNEIKGFHGFSVTGRSGKIDWSKSEIVSREIFKNMEPEKCYLGVYFEDRSWDGSDFFVPKKHLGCFISERLATLIKKEELTNIRLESNIEIVNQLGTVKVSIQNQNNNSFEIYE